MKVREERRGGERIVTKRVEVGVGDKIRKKVNEMKEGQGEKEERNEESRK